MTAKLNRIIHGDCIKEMGKLKAGSVDLVFADPPFNIGYDYDEYDDKRSCEDYLDWSKRWITEVKRVLKPAGTFWLAIGDEYAAELKVMATRELELTCRSWVIWYYTFGVHCKLKFTRSHAHLFHFVKNPKKFTFNDMAVRVPSARQLVYGDKRANPKGRVPDDTWIIPPSFPPLEGGIEGGTFPPSRGGKEGGTVQSRDRKGAVTPDAIPNRGWVLRPQDLPDGFTADSDTWYYSRVCGTFAERTRFHGCQMPEQLLGRIIRASSNERELVLDPFSGSATTLAVAKKLERNFLGFEISKQYVDAGRSRLRKIKPGDPLDGPENPLTSVPSTENGTIRTPDGRRVKRKGQPKRRGRPKQPRRPESRRQESLQQQELWR